MKKIIAISALIAAAAAANAQTPAPAAQTARLSLANAIELTFTGSSTSAGTAVTLSFNSVNDYANGVVSANQVFKVRSNKNFNVAVKARATNFTYTGPSNPAPVMRVSRVLDVMVTSNNTGGNVSNRYNNYKDVTTSNRSMIYNGTRGGNRTFAVQYRAKPGFKYPAGNYSVDVIYTATQL